MNPECQHWQNKEKMLCREEGPPCRYQEASKSCRPRGGEHTAKDPQLHTGRHCLHGLQHVDSRV